MSGDRGDQKLTLEQTALADEEGVFYETSAICLVA
jgi:hypothetical protein